MLKIREHQSKSELSYYYFGYGANANPDFFQKNISRFKVIGPSFIKGYSFSFNTPCEYEGKGFGGLEMKNGSRTYGTLYLVSSEALDLLDCLEWVDSFFYFRKKEIVFLKGGNYEAHLYFPCHPRPGLLPSLAYKNLVLNGARIMKFPLEYCKMLEEHEHGKFFKLDNGFNLSNPSKSRLLPVHLRKTHDLLRERLCGLI